MIGLNTRWSWTAALVALGLAVVPACDGGGGGASDADTDTDTDSDTDTDTDSDSDADAGQDASVDLVPIDSFGTTDLDYNLTPLPDPKADMPPLENLDPEFTPALAGQALPGTGTEIYEAEQAGWYLGYSTDALETKLRADGVARRLSDSSAELMAEALIGVADTSEKPGVLVTSDAVLNTFHNFYDNVLLGVELETLQPRLLAMLGAVKAEAAKRYNALPAGPTKAAALDVVAYLQVAESLMEPESEGIEEAWDVSAEEIQLVDDLGILIDGEIASRLPSPLFDRPEFSTTGDPECVLCDPCAGTPEGGGCGWYEGTGEDVVFIPCGERYCEDYSQYKPRGHYTYNETLERYFRSVMWLGRATFLNRSDQSTRGAVILVDSLKDAEVEMDGDAVPAADIWNQAMRAIGAFVGSMDDLNAFEIDGAVMEAMGGAFKLDALDDEGVLDAIHAEISELHDPEILSGFLNSLADMGSATKGLRLLGQVYMPDSYAMGQLVFGNVGPSATTDAEVYEAALSSCGITAGTDPEMLTPEQVNCVCLHAWSLAASPDDPAWLVCRGLPSGLDVATVLGNSKAEELALERFGSYAGYPEKLSELIAEFAGFDVERWGLSIGWTWLYALQDLLADADPGAPAFMRTDAWDKKNLETGLTSWAELRHDTILYVKESYTSDTDADTDSDSDVDYDFEYVEPHPRAYARLEAATRRLETLAVDEALISDESGSVMIALDQMEQFLARASEISVTELEGGELSEEDVWWIRGAGSSIAALENGLLDGLGLYDEEHEPDPDRLKTTIVADVHTWPKKEVVLEVGSGYLDYVAVLHQLPGGQWGVAVGPAFTYHEFEHDMGDRLTDEQWRELLVSDPDTGHPDWLD
jgi:hypothetical protein